MVSNWPFDDPPNVAVITTKRIMRDGYPILLVIHEDEGGEWQFLDGLDLAMADSSIVGLQTVVNHDTTILELADLPLGWYAERTDMNADWVRAGMPSVNELEEQ